ncbi:MAG: M23 family metallopeptidase [Eubacteriales bacterium]|nr:M23 family metallopeptidase [Eubacteriales bacterium]
MTAKRLCLFVLTIALALGIVGASPIRYGKTAYALWNGDITDKDTSIYLPIASRVNECFLDELEFDFANLLPTSRINVNLYNSLARYCKEFDSLNACMDESIILAASSAAGKAVNTHPEFRLKIECINEARLSWQQIAALYKVYRGELNVILKNAIVSTTTVVNGKIVLTVRFPQFDDIADYADQTRWFSARFAYYYLNTYYDDNGAPRDTAYRMLPVKYVEGLELPVEERFELGIKEGWYKPRSSGTRRHMGTDIKGAAKSELYSCTYGVVICTGYDRTAGNYVCIQDQRGYEYEYYHMYEISTFVERGDTVEAGQLIGLMGNTGNSAANHLHLAIVDPNGRHIDPYKVLVQAGYGRKP